MHQHLRLRQLALLWITPIAAVGLLAFGLYRTVRVERAAGDINIDVDVTLGNLALVFFGALLSVVAIAVRGTLTIEAQANKEVDAP